jgi:hypothetical protein
MSGEIHGLISREDAWRRWRPYGDRVDLHGSVTPDTLTNGEALQILLGADYDTQDRILDYWYDANDQRPWYAGISDVDLGAEPRLVDMLVASNEKQRQCAEQKRAKATDDGPAFAKKLGKGVVKLQRQGMLRPWHVDSIQSWLTAPDGLPYMQYTPMSQLEYARLALKYDNEVPSVKSSDCTDFYLGILRSTSGAVPKTDTFALHNRVHESVHGSLSGLEIYDITDDKGQRGPTATVVGTFAYEPSTEIVDGDDYSDVENAELNEGWTDFIARSLIHANSRLGKIYTDSEGYDAWAKTMGTIYSQSPDLYLAITDAILTEATPNDPDSKRLAIADMHNYADRKLGAHNSLDTLFRTNGGGNPGYLFQR